MRRILFPIFLLLFSVAVYGAPSIASAGTEHNLAGYAWSANIGWISFNCTNDGTCGTADYGVNLNPDGTLTGYAWTSSVGWIQFGSLAGFPSGSGTQAFNAKMSGSNLQGWAKAISADNSNWDGWISLSGSGYGVNQSGTSFTGYAWGSDVVGWILFDVQDVYPGICSNCGVALTGDASLDIRSGGPSGTSIVGSSSVPYNTIPTFVWTLTNIPNATCSVSKTSTGGTDFTTITGITSSGSFTGNALTGPTSYGYSIDCTNPTISHQVGSAGTSFTVATQPAGFSLGGTETAKIQFLASTTADSEKKTFFVNAVGGFSSNVSVSVSGSTCPGTAKYSLGGGAFSANPAPVTISSPYSAGSTFQARLAQRIQNACTVTLTGTSGALSATKDYIVTPVAFNPGFQEF